MLNKSGLLLIYTLNMFEYNCNLSVQSWDNFLELVFVYAYQTFKRYIFFLISHFGLGLLCLNLPLDLI